MKKKENCSYVDDIKDLFKMKLFEIVRKSFIYDSLPLIQNDQGLKEG